MLVVVDYCIYKQTGTGVQLLAVKSKQDARMENCSLQVTCDQKKLI
jgi:hypothetical protein